MTPQFTIGSTVKFGDQPWTVIGYHLVGKHWEVMFRSADGNHRSIDCKQLERYVDG